MSFEVLRTRFEKLNQSVWAAEGNEHSGWFDSQEKGLDKIDAGHWHIFL